MSPLKPAISLAISARDLPRIISAMIDPDATLMEQPWESTCASSTVSPARARPSWSWSPQEGLKPSTVRPGRVSGWRPRGRR